MIESKTTGEQAANDCEVHFCVGLILAVSDVNSINQPKRVALLYFCILVEWLSHAIKMLILSAWFQCPYLLAIFSNDMYFVKEEWAMRLWAKKRSNLSSKESMLNCCKVCAFYTYVEMFLWQQSLFLRINQADLNYGFSISTVVTKTR